MRTFVLSALAASAVAAPAPLVAQDEAEAEAPLALEEPGEDFSGMAERFKDPEQQRQMALMLRTMSEVLLDMPLAPLMEALNDVGSEMTGKDAPEVDPDATLRSMAEAMEKMMPALKDMAERMKDAAPPAE